MTKKLYRTTDLGLIAYLTINGFKPTNPPQFEKDILTFTFEHTEEFEQERIDYFSGNAQVDGFSFYRILQGLRLQARRLRNWKGGTVMETKNNLEQHIQFSPELRRMLDD